jgi:hypothetical protein
MDLMKLTSTSKLIVSVCKMHIKTLISLALFTHTHTSLHEHQLNQKLFKYIKKYSSYKKLFSIVIKLNLVG